MTITTSTRVSEIGEFGLIAALADALPLGAAMDAATGVGIGDDAAVWTPTPGERLVITTDALVENVHFRLDWTDWRALGHKMLAVNISDLAAMGAIPRLVVITLGLRGDERVVDLQDLYRGAGAIAISTGCRIAGGDIVRSPNALTFNITAIGESTNGKVLLRSGARQGHIVAVSGTLGASAAGLEILLGHAPATAATADLLRMAHHQPQPRVALGHLLLEHGASACMDLSDGLLGDLPKILVASNVSATISVDRIPVAAAIRSLFPDRWLDLATRGGEDYELLFTVPPAAWPSLKEHASTIGTSLTAIGEIVPADPAPDLSLLNANGERVTITASAFDHFGE